MKLEDYNMPEICMGCINKDAEVEIVLAEGQCLDSCIDCIPLVIKENAGTDNPVHSVRKIEL
jgi:hypothetical protein